MVATKEGNNARVRHGRFRGPAINYNLKVPGVKKTKKMKHGNTKECLYPTREYISEKWVDHTGNQTVFNASSCAPVEMTIMTLVIPDDDLTKEDLGWVGDIEDWGP